MKRMLLGVGNRLSHDDGVGPVVAQALVESDWIAIDCGTALENVIGIVTREQPDLLVIVDAAAMGKEPGEFCRLRLQAKDRMLASTHGLPLSFVLGNIESAAKETILIGIEPKDLSFGEGLSPNVDVSAQVLIQHLLHTNLDVIPKHELPL